MCMRVPLSPHRFKGEQRRRRPDEASLALRPRSCRLRQAAPVQQYRDGAIAVGRRNVGPAVICSVRAASTSRASSVRSSAVCVITSSSSCSVTRAAARWVSRNSRQLHCRTPRRRIRRTRRPQGHRHRLAAGWHVPKLVSEPKQHPRFVRTDAGLIDRIGDQVPRQGFGHAREQIDVDATAGRQVRERAKVERARRKLVGQLVEVISGGTISTYCEVTFTGMSKSPSSSFVVTGNVSPVGASCESSSCTVTELPRTNGPFCTTPEMEAGNAEASGLASTDPEPQSQGP